MICNSLTILACSSCRRLTKFTPLSVFLFICLFLIGNALYMPCSTRRRRPSRSFGILEELLALIRVQIVSIASIVQLTMRRKRRRKRERKGEGKSLIARASAQARQAGVQSESDFLPGFWSDTTAPPRISCAHGVDSRRRRAAMITIAIVRYRGIYKRSAIDPPRAIR